MRLPSFRTLRRAALLAAVVSAPAAAQGSRLNPEVSRALELERRGDYPGAARLWRQVLAGHPADLAALMGLERSLTAQSRLAEMIPVVQAAAAAAPSPGIWALAIRVWTAANQPDSARVMVERWSEAEPGTDAPFQEWGIAAMGLRDRATARAAFTLGRARLRQPHALAAELGHVAALEGDFPTAAREWTAALQTTPGYRTSALSVLGQITPGDRPALLEALRGNGSAEAERLATGLMARWGDPLGAARRLLSGPAAQGADATVALQELLDELRGAATDELQRARATLLEAMGERERGPRRGQRRLQAAQAYADAGDQTAARRMLGLLAQDAEASPALAAGAASTLIGVLVDEGGIEEADRRFAELRGGLGEEERQRLSLRLAAGWLRAGRLGRADSLAASDSTIEALAIRGRIRLYRGDLAGAAALLRDAGPWSGDRPAATGRLSVLGLLQVIEADSLPELGQALLRLEMGDSADAAARLEAVAGTLEPGRGGSELLLLAGRVYAGAGKPAQAERLFRSVMTSPSAASAAAAAFGLAELELKAGRRAEAIATLERLLIAHPTSAVVPQARRLLDVARGAIPPV